MQLKTPQMASIIHSFHTFLLYACLYMHLFVNLCLCTALLLEYIMCTYIFIYVCVSVGRQYVEF